MCASTGCGPLITRRRGRKGSDGWPAPGWSHAWYHPKSQFPGWTRRRAGGFLINGLRAIDHAAKGSDGCSRSRLVAWYHPKSQFPGWTRRCGLWCFCVCRANRTAQRGRQAIRAKSRCPGFPVSRVACERPRLPGSTRCGSSCSCRCQRVPNGFLCKMAQMAVRMG